MEALLPPLPLLLLWLPPLAAVAVAFAAVAAALVLKGLLPAEVPFFTTVNC